MHSSWSCSSLASVRARCAPVRLERGTQPTWRRRSAGGRPTPPRPPPGTGCHGLCLPWPQPPRAGRYREASAGWGGGPASRCRLARGWLRRSRELPPPHSGARKFWLPVREQCSCLFMFVYENLANRPSVHEHRLFTNVRLSVRL